MTKPPDSHESAKNAEVLSPSVQVEDPPRLNENDVVTAQSNSLIDPPKVNQNVEPPRISTSVTLEESHPQSLPGQRAISPEFVQAEPVQPFPKASRPGSPSPTTREPGKGMNLSASVRKIAKIPFTILARMWDLASLCILLAVISAIPVVQFASLGYLLVAAANLADGRKWSSALPGLKLAGKIGTFALIASLLWLPVWLVTDLSYSAQLLQPGSGSAFGWRLAAFAITFTWVTHVGWAAMRGGRWWHLLWPRPIRFVSQIWRPSTWSKASDGLYDLVSHLQFPRLWWLGLRASAGALLWITLPAALMLVGLRATDLPPAALIGLLGAIGMSFVLFYLPFLQIEFAQTGQFRKFFAVGSVRRRFRYRPWAHAFALVLLCLLCLPLYLLRIEATPTQLLWAPALVFVCFMLPAKLMLGAAMGWAESRKAAGKPPRRWFANWPARLFGFSAVAIYVGFLYVAQLVAANVMFLQHAFLVPVPFF